MTHPFSTQNKIFRDHTHYFFKSKRLRVAVCRYQVNEYGMKSDLQHIYKTNFIEWCNSLI